ncbi:uncharacterized protein LOC129571117 isoform X2 [Sitodiplosis mosellana]|uniref:uncharacterized protein LOC129571117 isoform X2 n=1 Tax=Sitodiplosis mosellana TaxID=263140 RepID=UPI0024449123|nr:uncharacterized protein LOC129571117 isoform X2 [Sitodiplosis mosellana]
MTNDTHSSDEVELKSGVNFKPEENPIPNNDANQTQSISGAVEKNDVTTTQPHITYNFNCFNCEINLSGSTTDNTPFNRNVIYNTAVTSVRFALKTALVFLAIYLLLKYLFQDAIGPLVDSLRPTGIGFTYANRYPRSNKTDGVMGHNNVTQNQM